MTSSAPSVRATYAAVASKNLSLFMPSSTRCDLNVMSIFLTMMLVEASLLQEQNFAWKFTTAKTQIQHFTGTHPIMYISSISTFLPSSFLWRIFVTEFKLKAGRYQIVDYSIFSFLLSCFFAWKPHGK